MLNTFPQLLVLGFFAPTLLRLCVAVAFLYVAYKQYKRRNEIAHLHFPIVGKGEWIPWLAILFHGVLGLMLLLGYHTQIAALLGALGLLKGLWLNRRYSAVVVLPNSAVIILFV